MLFNFDCVAYDDLPMKSFHSILSGLALGVALVACSPLNDSASVKLYFYSARDLNNAEFTQPVIVDRELSFRGDVVEAALRALMEGPTREEARGQNARMNPDLLALEPLFIDATMNGDAVILNFKEASLEILNSAAARQQMVKAPIEQTAKQFEAVKEVKYAIDGKEFDEWDA